MDSSSRGALCPECRRQYDSLSLPTHLCFEHGFCPFCSSEQSVTKDLYPELTCTRKELVCRLAQICRKVSDNLLSSRNVGFSPEACSSIYSAYITSFSILRKFPYGLPPPVSMLVHLIIEHPAVGYRLLCSLDGAGPLVSLYTRTSCGDPFSQGDIYLCPGCFLFCTDAADHCGQCKGYYRNHFRHYLYYQVSQAGPAAISEPSVHVSVGTILARCFCPASLRGNLDCAKRYMDLCAPSDSDTFKNVEDNLRGYFIYHPTFESLNHPGKAYRVESIELQGSRAFGRATVYSDIDFHLLIRKSDDSGFVDLGCEDVQDCLSSLVAHLQVPSSSEWLGQLSMHKPIKYHRGAVGFIELSLKDAIQSVSLVFGSRDHIATGRRRIAVMRSFYLDRFAIYERAEAFLKQWLFMSRTTEGSTAMGLTKFTSLTILQRVCLFTDVGCLLRRFICYDPSDVYKPMLDPSSDGVASGELLTLYQCNCDTSGAVGVVDLTELRPNSELVDPAKFRQLVMDHCADKQSQRDTVDAVLRIADTPEDVSFIWAFALVHEVLRYHRDFYQETLGYKLDPSQQVSTENTLYKLRDLLSISNGSGSFSTTETRTCVSVHVTKTMTLACTFRILLVVEASMIFLRYFLPTPPNCSTADRETLQPP